MIKNPSHPKKGQQRTRICRFSKAGVEYIDYKQLDVIKRYTNDQGKILPRRVTGTSAKHQRMLATAVKRARFIGLVPFVSENIR